MTAEATAKPLWGLMTLAFVATGCATTAVAINAPEPLPPRVFTICLADPVRDLVEALNEASAGRVYWTYADARMACAPNSLKMGIHSMVQEEHRFQRGTRAVNRRVLVVDGTGVESGALATTFSYEFDLQGLDPKRALSDVAHRIVEDLCGNLAKHRPEVEQARRVDVQARAEATQRCMAGPTAPCPPGTLRIPAGTRTLGTSDLTVCGYCLDETEVTVSAYRACVDTGRCSDNGLSSCGVGGTWDAPDKEAHPINCVDWSQASAYCHSTGGLLPTEHQWEWAARGGEGAQTYAWGNDKPAAQLCYAPAAKGTCPVKSHAPGTFGLYDMAGNVWEWTSSPYQGSRRMMRGGGWTTSQRHLLRVESGRPVAPTTRGDDLGFRCAH